MTLEEHIKRYDDRAKSIRRAVIDKEESQEVVELLRKLEYIKTMTSVYEKIRKGNMKDGVIDAIDDHDILFNYFKQVKEVFEGSDSE